MPMLDNPHALKGVVFTVCIIALALLFAQFDYLLAPSNADSVDVEVLLGWGIDFGELSVKGYSWLYVVLVGVLDGILGVGPHSLYVFLFFALVVMVFLLVSRLHSTGWSYPLALACVMMAVANPFVIRAFWLFPSVFLSLLATIVLLGTLIRAKIVNDAQSHMGVGWALGLLWFASANAPYYVMITTLLIPLLFTDRGGSGNVISVFIGKLFTYLFPVAGVLLLGYVIWISSGNLFPGSRIDAWLLPYHSAATKIYVDKNLVFDPLSVLTEHVVMLSIYVPALLVFLYLLVMSGKLRIYRVVLAVIFLPMIVHVVAVLNQHVIFDGELVALALLLLPLLFASVRLHENAQFGMSGVMFLGLMAAWYLFPSQLDGNGWPGSELVIYERFVDDSQPNEARAAVDLPDFECSRPCLSDSF